MSMEERGTGTLVSVQILRGLAALMVVFHHAITFLNDRYGFSLEPFDLGAIGVDLFFVISGFIMFWTTRTHDGSWSGTLDFWRKRAVRIMPLYWLVTSALALLLWLLPSAFNSMKFDIFQILKSLFFIPYYNENGEIHPIVDPGWTLNYEMFFYLVFGVCLCFFGRHALIGCLLLLAGLVVAGAAAAPSDAMVSTYTSPLLLEFSFGLLAAFIHARYGSLRPWVGLFLLVLVCGWLSRFQASFPVGYLSRALLWGGASFLVVLSALALEPWVARVRFTFGLKYLGDASYSVYLVHTLFFLALGRVVSAPGMSSWELLVAFSGGAVVFGCCTYIMVEKPAGRVAARMTHYWGRTASRVIARSQ